MERKIKIGIIVALAAAVILGGMMAVIYGGAGKKAEQPQKKAAEPAEEGPALNPLTGIELADQNAEGRRITAFVVENAPDARPQWGMDDKKYSPDIILQGEVEGGITRTLWLYADYKKLPDVIGPMRSARPPYIHFSELFDAIFIHWGLSHSKAADGYVGADKVFYQDKVDHINQMSYSDPVGLYGRDSSRAVSSEHTGIVHGDKVAAAIKDKGFRTTSKDCTELKFNDKAKKAGSKACNDLTLQFSRVSYEPAVWTYNKEDKKYHTQDFQNSLSRDNLLVLFDQTEYITKTNYKGSGSGVTYCDYGLSGGKGSYLRRGTVEKIRWKVKEGKLVLIDKEAMDRAAKKAEEKAKSDSSDESSDSSAEQASAEAKTIELKLNPGKTWIGWASANNGGAIHLSE